MKNSIKDRFLGIFGSASGGGAIAGAHNVCHVLCIGVASMLAIFGIGVSSTTLMFLENYALPFWAMGLFFLVLAVVLYLRTGHIAKKLNMFNAGMLVMGFPYVQKESFVWGFWLTGGFIAIIPIIWFLNDRYNLNLNMQLRNVKMDKEKILLYGTLIFVFVILAFGIYSTARPVESRQNSLLVAENCGDLTNPNNIQHLSHHTDLKPCLDKVDPILRKQVLGW